LKNRCKHLNCTIKRESVQYTSFEVENGKVNPDPLISGETVPTGLYIVDCRDCGQEIRIMRVPDWFERLRIQI